MKMSFLIKVFTLFFFSALSVCSFAANKTTAKHQSTDKTDYIIIVDITNIGGDGPLCDSGNGTNTFTSTQIFNLPQALSSQSLAETLTFDLFKSNQDVSYMGRFQAWSNCDGNTCVSTLDGFNGTSIVIIPATRGIGEIRFVNQAQSYLVRIYEGLAPNTLVVETTSNNAWYYQCEGVYENPCYSNDGESLKRDADDAITINNKTIDAVQVNPNPFTDAFQAILVADQATTAKVALLDLMGREVRSFIAEIKEGTNQIAVDGGDLSAGTYVLAIQTSDETLVKKVVKQ
jgi:Secretion system C-terminal sorting domain